jgi:hypothetical protein
MTNYLVINDNGDAFRVTPTDNTYNDLSTLVDGMIECVGLPGGADAWCNEEGLLRNPQDFYLNLLATHIVNHWTGNGGYRLVGPVVFAGHDGEGNTTPVPLGFIEGEVSKGMMLMEGEWTVAECAARMQQSRDVDASAGPVSA